MVQFSLYQLTSNWALPWIFFWLALFSPPFAVGSETIDPTLGAPFLPWLWENQLQPVIEVSTDPDGLLILSTGSLATILSHQYDAEVFDHNRRKERLIFNDEYAGYLSTLGSGIFAIGIAATQIIYDQKNGLRHTRALALTTLSHVTFAFLIGRERPGGRGDYLPFKSSYPSGHASSAFATATSLSYAYGWLAGIPSYLIASSIAVARVSENAHWLSDVVIGATLGIFWGRASYAAPANGSIVSRLRPIPVGDGLVIEYVYRF